GDDELARVIARHDTDRVRYAGDRAPRAVLESVGDTGIYVSRQPVLAEGRIELLWYLTEQSISHDYHRYGNLGARTGEPRRPVAWSRGPRRSRSRSARPVVCPSS